MLSVNTKFRLSEDSDLLRYEPYLDTVWRRTDKAGNIVHDWDIEHLKAVMEIDRRLRSSKDVAEQFEIGKLGLRAREQLRDCAAFLALHFIFVAADTMGGTKDLSNKAGYYWKRAEEVFMAEQVQLDYDTDNSGDIDESEKNLPFADRFIRG